MELEDRYNFVYVVERVQEILEDAGGEIDDYREELVVLARWAAKDRFDRRAVNRRLKKDRKLRIEILMFVKSFFGKITLPI